MVKVRRARAGLLVLLAVLLVGCSGADSPSSPSASSSSSSSPDVPADATEPVILPRAVGRSVGEARRTLAGIGLETRLIDVRGSACLVRGEVLEQRPPSGSYVPAGSTITLVVNRPNRDLCGIGGRGASEPLRRAGSAFAAFARGEAAGPPADTPVALFLDGVRLDTTADPTDRSSWRMCPPSGSAAGRTCPFSAVDVVADWPGPLAITSQAPTHACVSSMPFEARGAGGTATVTLTPDEELDCATYWAVQLAVNDVGQVVAVNLVVAEP